MVEGRASMNDVEEGPGKTSSRSTNGAQPASRRGRWIRRILIGLLVVPVILWAGLVVGLKLTMAKEVPLGVLAGMITEGLLGNVICAVRDCEAELAEGMEIASFADDLLASTPVSLEIDEAGRVYLAETSRRDAGAEDNRRHPDWLMDDLASRTIEDRRRYYEKAIAEGRIEDPDHFTRNSDRVVRLEDRDGDGRADEREVVASWNEMLSGLVAGVEAREGTLWVTAVPSVYRIDDVAGKGGPGPATELARGFGVKTSLGGHDLHGLVWGPDGRLYFSMGDRGYSIRTSDGRLLEPPMGPGRGAVFRMNADGSDLEVFATGVRNPQELAFDAYGNLFTGDNNGDGGDAARLVHLVEGGETGWAMPFQTLVGDYIRGPWVAERLWEQQHPTQPAWVLPPVAYLGNGPAGFLHYPGLGLPERYADHFFLCDYAYTRGRSGIWSFAVEPRGATFEMVDAHEFAWSILATDFDFGWDGRMFASVFDQFGQDQSIAVLRHLPSLADPRIAELSEIVSRPIAEYETDRLLELLEFPDQRLRLRAQFELAERAATESLVGLALDENATELARRHALWAIGQLGASALEKLAPDNFAFAADESNEYRAQLARIAGEARAVWLAKALRAGLQDDSPRVQFFSAQSLGSLGDSASVAGLFELIRDNADRDVYLRHAAVWALHRIGAADAAWTKRDDPSRSVRLGVLLVLRNGLDPRIAYFLADEDPLLVVEAARAIYDGPIDEAMPSLASLAAGIEPAAKEDRQTAQALHRRVLGANVRLRSLEGAATLARYAADERQLDSLREQALEALGNYAAPPPRDWTMGFYRPLPPVSKEMVAAVFQTEGRALIESSLGARAVELASAVGALPLADDELLAIVESNGEAQNARVSALNALRSRSERGPGPERAEIERAISAGLAAVDPEIRMAARELLLASDPVQGRKQLLEAAASAESLAERQQAWRFMGDFDDVASGSRLREALTSWEAGTLEPAVALDVIDSARRRSEPDLVESAHRALTPPPGGLEAGRRWAVQGGDPEAGRIVFETHGDCQRCHSRGAGGHGGGIGPSLAGIRSRGAGYVLESILEPQASIAQGFGSVVLEKQNGVSVAGLLIDDSGELLRIDAGGAEPIEVPRAEVASMIGPSSGMPAIGLGLPPEALRDLVAYVMSLD